ncbi:MAG: tetratricopeptide repeat protein [Candidatus Sumerlaeales bacterium]|nr:tetratricopeptide repeat protein [Candidatus Sumerlaeales bacterium]
MTDQNAYATLHLRKGATLEEVKGAWISMVKKYPPEGDTEGRFMVLQKAYEVLRDPLKRAHEDVFTLNYPIGQFIFSEDSKTTDDMPAVAERAQKSLEAYKTNPDEDTKAEVISSFCRLAYKNATIKQWKPAIDCWKQILDVDPTNQKAKHNYIFAHIYVAYFYSLHKLYEPAIELLEIALQMLPDNLDVMQNIAILYDDLNQPDKAAEYWSEIERRWRAKLDQHPDDDYLKESLAALHMFHGARLNSKVQNDETKGQAVEQFRKVLELDPNNYDVHFKIANTLMEEKKFNEAANELKTILQKRPNDNEVITLLGWAYLNMGKVEIAFSTWRRALAKSPKAESLRKAVYNGHLQIGRKFKESGLYTQALVHLKEVQKISPQDPSIIVEVGEAMMRKGDKRSAMIAFQRVLELEPKNKEAKRFLNEIRLRG